MTTWPSSNKAQTTTTDQPTDTISGARDDINKTISNVNDIIDSFNITSPTDGDLVQYSSSTGNWESVSIANVGTNMAVFKINVNTGDENVSGSEYRRDYDLVSTGSFVTEDSAGAFVFTLPAGTYYTELANVVESDNETNFNIYNETDAGISAFHQYNEIGTTAEGLMTTSANAHFTLAGSKTMSFRQSSATPSNRNLQGYVKIFKLV